MLFPASTWKCLVPKNRPKISGLRVGIPGSLMLSQDLRKWRTLKNCSWEMMGHVSSIFYRTNYKPFKTGETLPFWVGLEESILKWHFNRPSLGTEVMKTCLILVSDSSDLAKAYWELLDTPTKYQLPIHLTCHKDLWTLLPAYSHCKGACASACTLSSPSSSSLNKFAARNDQHTNPCGAPNSYKVPTKCVNAFQNSSQIKMDLGSCILASYHI